MPLPAEGHTIDLSNPLDMLYLNGDKTELEKALKLFRKNGGLKRYRLAQSDNVQKVLDEIASLDPGKISPILYESYSENLRKAVDQVFKRDSETGLSDRLRANVSRFAAYKALNATREVQQKLGEDIDEAKRVIRTYNRYQATEYNTTVSRSRTAKQFEQFNDPDSLRLFPNLRWLPSRSADPREQHMLFYNKVWAKDDDFWNENTPGSLWNCKCDWEETDDPVTDNPSGLNKSANGLKGNPAVTGEVFSNDHTYMNLDGADVIPFYRAYTRQSMKQYSVGITYNDKYVTIDALNIREITKGAINEERFFIKVEIVRHLDKYIPKLIPREGNPTEEVDLEHNTSNSKFLRRKRKFEVMEVYTLEVGNFKFEVKFGRYRDGRGLNLYSITDIS